MKILSAIFAIVGTYLLAPHLFPKGSLEKIKYTLDELKKSLHKRVTKITRLLSEPFKSNRLEDNISSTHRKATIITITGWTLLIIFCVLISSKLIILILLLPLYIAALYWLFIEPKERNRNINKIPSILFNLLIILLFPFFIIGTSFLYIGWMINVWILIIFELVWGILFSIIYFIILGQLKLITLAAGERPDRVIGYIGLLLVAIATIIMLI